MAQTQMQLADPPSDVILLVHKDSVQKLYVNLPQLCPEFVFDRTSDMRQNKHTTNAHTRSYHHLNGLCIL